MGGGVVPRFEIADVPLERVRIPAYSLTAYPVVLSPPTREATGTWTASGRHSMMGVLCLLAGSLMTAFAVALPIVASPGGGLWGALTDPVYVAVVCVPLIMGGVSLWAGLVHATTAHRVEVHADSISVHRRRLWRRTFVSAPATEFSLQLVPCSQQLPKIGGSVQSYLLGLLHANEHLVWLAQSRTRGDVSGPRRQLECARDALGMARTWMSIIGIPCQIPRDDALIAGTSRGRGKRSA
jgi:hypothetical protein